MRVASVGQELKCFNWSDHSLISTYRPKGGVSINTISWGKDSGWVILVPKSGSPQLISINNAKLLYTINTVQLPKCAAFQNCTKRNVAISSSDGNLQSYDIKTKSVKKTFQLSAIPFFKLEYTLKDTYLLGGSENGEIVIFNTTSGTRAGCLKVPKSQTLSNFRCSPIKNNLVGGCSEEGIVTLWDINVSKSIFHLQPHIAPVNDLCFPISNEKLLISIGGDRRICIVDIGNKKLALDKLLDYTATAIDFCPDGNGIAVGLFNGTMLTYDIRNMKNYTNKFSAHDTNIKQILFEKISTTHQNSLIDLPDLKESSPVVDGSISSIACRLEQNMDSEINENGMDFICCELQKNDSEINTGMDTNIDSLIGLNSTDESETATIKKSNSKVESSNFCAYSTPEQNGNKRLNINKVDKRKSVKSQFHSTPIDTLVSGPVCTSSPLITNINPALTEDLKKFIRDTIKEETQVIKNEVEVIKNKVEAIESEVEAFKNEMKTLIKDQIYHTTAELRQGQFDIIRLIIREFMDLRDETNLIRNQL